MLKKNLYLLDCLWVIVGEDLMIKGQLKYVDVFHVLHEDDLRIWKLLTKKKG